MGRIHLDLSFPKDRQNSGNEYHDRSQAEHGIGSLVGGKDEESEHQEQAERRVSSPEVVPSGESTANTVLKDQDFPFRPRHLAHTDLPPVPATEVAKRHGRSGARLWIVVDDVVLDCTDFKKRHPGGKSIIEEFGGHDCSWQWWTFHSQKVMEKYGQGLRVARTSGAQNKHEKPERRPFKLQVVGEQW